MKRLDGPGSEMLQNGTETEHSRIYNLEHLGGLGPGNDPRSWLAGASERLWAEMIQNVTRTDNLEHLEGLGPKLSEMLPKLTI